MPFYSTSVKSPQFRNLKYSIVNKCPILGYYFSDLVDFAPYRGYNEVTVKETTKTITQNGSRRYRNMAATKEQERKALARKSSRNWARIVISEWPLRVVSR